jgi:hypothetical protein
LEGLGEVQGVQELKSSELGGEKEGVFGVVGKDAEG